MELLKQEKEIYELAELLMQSENLEASAIILRDFAEKCYQEGAEEIMPKTKDDMLLEILAPLGTEIHDPTGEYADLFAYLYDKISPLLSNEA